MTPRPLSPSEAVLWWLDQATRLNFTTVVEVEGLPVDHLPAALAALQRRHPALRLRIQLIDGAPHFLPSERPIPVREASDLRAALEEEIDRPMPSDEGPLLRCVHLPGHVLLTFHHSVGDGFSGVYAARDLLTLLAAGARGEAMELAPFADLVSADDHLPRRLRRPRFLATAAAFAGRRAWSGLREGPPLHFGTPGGSLDARVPRVCLKRLEPELVAALAARAKAEDTTLHGALAAAHLRAVAALHGGGATMGFATPVSLRPHLEPPVGEQLGYYVGAADARLRVDPEGDPWALARAIRGQVIRDVQSGACMMLSRFGPRLLRHFTRGPATPLQVAERLYALRGTTGLTNLGRVRIDADLGPMRLKGLHFVVSPSALGDQVATAIGYEGAVYWNLCFSEPTVSRDQAEVLWTQAEVCLSEAL